MLKTINAIAVEYLPLFESEAKKRQGQRNDLKPNISPKLDECEETQKPSQTRSTAQAAEKFGASHGYIAEAKKAVEGLH